MPTRRTTLMPAPTLTCRCARLPSHSVTSFAAAGDAAARPRPCRSSGDRAAEHEGASLVLSVGPAPSVHHRSRTEAAGLTDIEPGPDVRVGPELRCVLLIQSVTESL